MWTKKVKVHFDNSFYNVTTKNTHSILYSELRESKCDQIISSETTENIHLWNMHYEQKKQSAIQRFHLGCMPNSLNKVFKIKARISTQILRANKSIVL